MSNDCVFCQLIEEKSRKIIYEDDLVVAFPTNDPKVNVHLLIIPRRHVASINDLTPEDEPAMGRLIMVGQRLAAENGISQSGYRVSINTNDHAGQTVYHIHMHLLGGEPLGEAISRSKQS